MPISPVQYPMFQPAMRQIAAIANGNPTVITTTFNHNYQTGLIVRIDIPLNGGMLQINGQQGVVTRIDALNFSLPIDSTLYDIFVIPANTTQWPQVVPIGEVTLEVFQATRNVLPDSILP
jgi:hypothetical protein